MLLGSKNHRHYIPNSTIILQISISFLIRLFFGRFSFNIRASVELHYYDHIVIQPGPIHRNSE